MIFLLFFKSKKILTICVLVVNDYAESTTTQIHGFLQISSWKRAILQTFLAFFFKAHAEFINKRRCQKFRDTVPLKK